MYNAKHILLDFTFLLFFYFLIKKQQHYATVSQAN